MRIGVIVNPHSKKNRARPDRGEVLRRIVGTGGFVLATSSVDEIQPALRDFIGRGVEIVVSDGGDGSYHWLVNRLRAETGLHGGLLTIPANGGTIDFVARQAGVHGQAEHILRRLLSARGIPAPVSVPSLLYRGTGADGRSFERLGFALAAVGVGRNFFDRYYEAPLPGPRTILKVIGKTLLGRISNGPFFRRSFLEIPALVAYQDSMFRAVEAEVEVDGRTLGVRPFSLLNAGAFPGNLGGVIRLFPKACRGFFHVFAGDPPPHRVVANLPNIFLGRPIRDRRVFDGPVRDLRARFKEPIRPISDGEILPEVLELHVTPGPPILIPPIDAR